MRRHLVTKLDLIPEEIPVAFRLPSLPYATSALEPSISKKTLLFHYEKHHQAYVDKTNQLVEGTEMANLSLVEIIERTHGVSDQQALFNNAAQVWNHSFFWDSLSPQGGGEPPQATLKKEIDLAFGSVEAFKAEFKKVALSQFGSGWTWLVQEKSGQLAITKTGNADLPFLHGQRPLLTCDVWEHAYYLDYQNRRPDYVQAFLASLINWDFVAENLKS